jgi:hypothetical protein
MPLAKFARAGVRQMKSGLFYLLLIFATSVVFLPTPVFSVAQGPDAKAAGDDDTGTLLPVGSKWTGKMDMQTATIKQGSQDISARVVPSDGNDNEVMLRVKEGLKVWLFQLKIDGNNVTVTDIKLGNNRFEDIKMTGTVKEGALTLSGGWVHRRRRIGNGENATITLSRVAIK